MIRKKTTEAVKQTEIEHNLRLAVTAAVNQAMSVEITDLKDAYEADLEALKAKYETNMKQLQESKRDRIEAAVRAGIGNVSASGWVVRRASDVDLPEGTVFLCWDGKFDENSSYALLCGPGFSDINYKRYEFNATHCDLQAIRGGYKHCPEHLIPSLLKAIKNFHDNKG